DAAHKACLRIHQFVHEPLAALYGYLRSQPDFKRRCAELENRAALVVDWGGGTLDLTLCKFMRGALVQIGNQGDAGVGGDRFDEAIADHVRNKHREHHSLESGREDTELATARLIEQCELAKKQLSTTASATVFVQDFFKSTGPERTLEEKLTRKELIEINAKLIADGLKNIDKLLETTDYGRPTVAFCLATGGMCQIPFIRDRLREIFSFDRVKAADHPERLIAEGAAWIAHNDLALELAKPVELYHADNTYVPVLPADFRLPIENKQSRPVSLQVYCVDPRDGFAKLQFVRPAWPGRSLPSDPRQIYTTQILKVDPNAAPFVERIMLDINIDHNLVVRVRARSGEDDNITEIHDLEFGLDLGAISRDGSADETSGGSGTSEPSPQNASQTAGSVRLRSNVFLHSHCIDGDPNWGVVPGEIVEQYSPRYLRIPLNSRQLAEKMYYEPCSLCHRGIYEIMLKGCDVRQCPEGSKRASAAESPSAQTRRKPLLVDDFI
ncbi:MAG TPA: Hsp70 family protein, partial [Candidatus Binataceae bacterium]|nr:Hsp70 family protein [Candidatus Binataceae bacterium]